MRTLSLWPPLLAVTLFTTIAGCGDSPSPLPDASVFVPTCAVDLQCSDGVFCNGEERCAPQDPEADARGCAPPATDACLPGQTCQEGARLCETVCAMETDADGDGHDALACGGDDCDDSDADRFPGNPEVCDDAGHDEDCNPASLGSRDLDGDGATDAACCNGDTCGLDCDDTEAAIRPGAVEACDGLDNDCDTATDEGVEATFYVDADGDGYGDRDDPGAELRACRQPTGYSTNALDCDDNAASVNPAAFDRCDGAVDDDCSGVVDDPEGGCDCQPGEFRACPLLGACGQGRQDCISGIWGACSVFAAPDACDGADNDCDGDPDPSCACVAGATLVCGTDVGECSSGVRVCGGDGSFSGCLGAVNPSFEVCNQRDDDCDGQVDEGVATQTFYPDPDGDGIGTLVGAVEACAPPDGGPWAERTLDGCVFTEVTPECENVHPALASHTNAQSLAVAADRIVVVGARSGTEIGLTLSPARAEVGTRTVSPIEDGDAAATPDAVFMSVAGDVASAGVVAAGPRVLAWDDLTGSPVEVVAQAGARVIFTDSQEDGLVDPVVWTGTDVTLYENMGAGTFIGHPVASGTIDWAGRFIDGSPEQFILYAGGGQVHLVRVTDPISIGIQASVSIPGNVRACAVTSALVRSVVCATSAGVHLVDFDSSRSTPLSALSAVAVRSEVEVDGAGIDEGTLAVIFETPPRLERWVPNPNNDSYERIAETDFAPRDALPFDADGDGDVDILYLTDTEVRVIVNEGDL